MTQRILITGGTGFVGSHLSAALVRAGHRVVTLSRTGRFVYPQALAGDEQSLITMKLGDIRDESLLRELVGDTDVIFHYAAAVGVAASSENAKQFIDTNIGGTANLVDVLKSESHQVKAIVLGSSLSVYGEGNYNCSSCGIVRPELRLYADEFRISGDWNPRCPICRGKTNSAWTPENVERCGESIYAITKKTQEDLLVSTCRLLEIPLAILRYCTVYGPGQPPNHPYSRFIQQMLDNQSPQISEDGNQTRDFIYIDDAVRASMLFVDHSLPGVRVYNVGSGIQTPLLQFVRQTQGKLSELTGKCTVDPFVTQKFLPGDVRHCQADCSRMIKDHAYMTEIDCEKGIGNLLSWYCHNPALAV